MEKVLCIDGMDSVWRQEAGMTVFAPFEQGTGYFGRFARIHDPEGNPIELWEPVATPQG